MDKIWYRNPSKSEVIDRCGGDEKTRMTTQNRQQSNAKKTKYITESSFKIMNYSNIPLYGIPLGYHALIG